MNVEFVLGRVTQPETILGTSTLPSLPRHHPVSNGADEDNDADKVAETVPAMVENRLCAY